MTLEEMKAMHARLAELGLEAVKVIAASDGFPSPWRLHVHQWIARGGKAPPEEENAG
jgi:hypothetical protein